MFRFFHLVRLAALFCLCAMTACAPAGKQLMGDPENPYPLQSPPRVGDLVHLPTGIVVTPAQMFTIAGDARIVYLGETHDNPASHRLELQVLQALAERHPGRQALGMEMFVRSQQPALDRWVAGLLDEKAFLKEAHWFENWKSDFAYYRDLLYFARDRHIPVIALNAEKSLVAAVRGKAPDQLSAGEQASLPHLDMTDPYQRGLTAAIFGDLSHGELAREGFARAQTVWDETMAESAARFLSSPSGADKHLLVIAGGYHVSYGFGIPRRVFRRLPASYVVIGGREIDIPADKRNRLMNVDLPEFPMVPYDFLAYLPYESLPETGVRLGVLFEPAPAGKGLVVRNVADGSNAARAGLLQGDLLLAIDGSTLSESFDLIYAIQQKKPGDRGSLQIERQGRTLAVDVLFQAASEEHPHGKR
jgi:uncharacterized iron-regulated protein